MNATRSAGPSWFVEHEAWVSAGPCRSPRPFILLAALASAAAVGLGAQTAPLPGASAADLAGIGLVSLAGVRADLTRSTSEQEGLVLRVRFDKAGEERRLLALEMRPVEPLAECRAAELGYRLTLDPALTARFAVIAYERGGGAWFRTSSPVAPADAADDRRLSLQGMRQTGFSQDASGHLEWDRVERLWVGLALDGKGTGVFELSKLVLTGEPCRATEPVPLFRADVTQWSVGADPAVTGRDVQRVDVEGSKCLKLNFHFPGGRHMYFVPVQAVEELEYSAYAGLRFTYRATVPVGVNGLLICVREHGGQFVATPPPPATGEWVTVTVPWNGFPLGAWSTDDNGRLDVDAISQVSVGVHGTAAGDGGPGEILLKAIDAVPQAP